MFDSPCPWPSAAGTVSLKYIQRELIAAAYGQLIVINLLADRHIKPPFLNETQSVCSEWESACHSSTSPLHRIPQHLYTTSHCTHLFHYFLLCKLVTKWYIGTVSFLLTGYMY